MDRISHDGRMSDFIQIVVTTYAALFPICNPLGNAAIFLSMTDGEKRSQRATQALKGSLYVFGILAGFLLAGTFILSFFGISLEGVRIAGGFVVASVGVRLLSASRHQTPQPNEEAEAREKPDISFTPLALPLLAGPGSIAVVMTQSTQNPHLLSWGTLASLIGIALISVTCWIVLREADKVLGVIGVNGATALTKIMAFLLLCIGVQLMIAGIQGVYPVAH